MTKRQNNVLEYYTSLIFQPLDRPRFYTSFVTTIDGKIFVNKGGYWPIGSKTDYTVFTWLRAHADIIVDGKNTALKFGKHMIDTIHSEYFQAMRKEVGKDTSVEYAVVSNHPDAELIHALENKHNFKPLLLTSKTIDVQRYQEYFTSEGVLNEEEHVVDALLSYFQKQNYRHVFIDGGPTLLAAFVEKNLLDDIFLTISPKLFGNKDNLAMTMIEGILLNPRNVPEYNLVHVAQEEDELFLHYTLPR